MPAAIEGVRRLQEHVPVKPVIAGGALLLTNVAPAEVQAVLREAGIERWLRGVVAPPCRMVAGPEYRDGGQAIVPARLSHASEGHDLQWLVNTAGHVDAGAAALAAGAAIDALVTGTPVSALDPDTDDFTEMVLLRTHPAAAAAMRRLVSVTQWLHVAGRRYRLLPFTQTRVDVRRAPPARSQAAQLHDAALAPATRSRRRHASYHLVVCREAADHQDAVIP